MQCVFVSDLHGKTERFRTLFRIMRTEAPAAVFIGGDLLPSFGWASGSQGDFITGTFAAGLAEVRKTLGDSYPPVFVILGNDDLRTAEAILQGQENGRLWHYIHEQNRDWQGFRIFGYSCVPPTPFLLKDWERYDVSRYVDPGCISPEEGRRSVAVSPDRIRYGTIRGDLARLAGHGDHGSSIFLFHAPPYRTLLDRADLDGHMVDHVPLDVHVGSIAVRRFIEEHQPRLTLHGHIHESTRLTGAWMDTLGHTVAVNAAHDGPELAVVRFDPHQPARATRELL